MALRNKICLMAVVEDQQTLGPSVHVDMETVCIVILVPWHRESTVFSPGLKIAFGVQCVLNLRSCNGDMAGQKIKGMGQSSRTCAGSCLTSANDA